MYLCTRLDTGMADVGRLICNCGSRSGFALSAWKVVGAHSPQVPNAYFAIIAGRDYAVLLLMCKVYVSDGHQVSIWDVCHLLQASHIPHLKQSGVAVVTKNHHAEGTVLHNNARPPPLAYRLLS